MDLTDFDPVAASSKGAFLHLRNPLTRELLFFPSSDESKSPVGLNVLGQQSTEVAAALKATAKDLADGRIDEEEQGVLLLISSIVGWSGELPVGGENLKYSAANVRKLVTNPKTAWIVEQVLGFSMTPQNYAQNVISA